jgi:hypothetical protein
MVRAEAGCGNRCRCDQRVAQTRVEWFHSRRGAGPVVQAAVKGLGSFSECHRRPQLKQTYCRMINPLCRSVAVSTRRVPPHFLHRSWFDIVRRRYTTSDSEHTGEVPMWLKLVPNGSEESPGITGPGLGKAMSGKSDKLPLGGPASLFRRSGWARTPSPFSNYGPILDKMSLALARRHLSRADRVALFLRDRTFAIARARKELDYNPLVPIQRTIRATAEWFQAQGHLLRLA